MNTDKHRLFFKKYECRLTFVCGVKVSDFVHLFVIFALLSVSIFAQRRNDDLMPRFPKGAKILFQGDSITDGGRGRNDDPNHILGQDYAYLIAAASGGHFPENNWTFFNRGVSGNKITDLAARWQTDTIELKPDYLSILVGINDVASFLENRPNPTTAEEFEKDYDELLRETVEKLPNVKLILGEPFVFPIAKIKEKFSAYQAETKKRQAIIEKLALKYHTPIVHFQKVLDEGAKRAPIEYWVWDGVHPTYAGHQLMADEWMRTVNQYYFGKNSKGKK